MKQARLLRHCALCAVVVLAAACGGGGGGSSSSPPPSSGSTPPPPPPSPPSSPPVNHSPNIIAEPRSQHVIAGRPVDIDLELLGAAPIFSDPDGDVLTLEIYWDFRDSSASQTWQGLQLEGDRLQGIATGPGLNRVGVQATDGRGGLAIYQIEVSVTANQAPAVIAPNPDRLVHIGQAIQFDAIAAGSVFEDPDGDVLTYSVNLEPAPRGLQVSGTTVTGQLSAVGAVRVVVQASDGFGGVQSDVLMVAAPAPEPGPPHLPAESYVYDELLLDDLPEIFRLSREITIPFWDTTPPDNPTTNAGATLGRVLFYDKRLSITNTHSCGSCHEQKRGFTVGTPFGAGVTGELSHRNPMALANARYNLHGRYFGDLRAANLEELALMPIQDQIELGNTIPAVIDKLVATDFYPQLFAVAFGTEEITPQRISHALAQFLRSLISYRTKFDRAFDAVYPPADNDPSTVLTPQELLGREMFVNGLCGHCHGSEVQTNDTPANNGIDAQFTDPGAGNGEFRATSLRNIAVSGPYMHDGRFATLREVIEHYDHGVNASPQLAFLLRDHQGAGSEFPRRLNMTEEQKQALEAFLNTLTDDAFLNDPKFSDPF
jgi:cytochrome c peroxidase